MHNKFIFLLEDDIDLNDLIAEILESEGFGIIPHTDIGEAYRSLPELHYNLAIMDRSLTEKRISGLSGDDVGRLSREINPLTPIITLSGYEDKVDYATISLTKPITRKTLINVVNDLIS